MQVQLVVLCTISYVMITNQSSCSACFLSLEAREGCWNVLLNEILLLFMLFLADRRRVLHCKKELWIDHSNLVSWFFCHNAWGKLQNLRPWGTRDLRLWRWKFRLGAPSAGGIEYKVCPLSKVKHSRCPPDRDRANDLYVISPSASVFINISQLMILISQQGLNDWFSIWNYHLLFIYYSRLHKVSDLLIHSSTTRMTGLQTRTCLEFGRPVWHQHLSLCVPWGPVCQ